MTGGEVLSLFVGVVALAISVVSLSRSHRHSLKIEEHQRAIESIEQGRFRRESNAAGKAAVEGLPYCDEFGQWSVLIKNHGPGTAFNVTVLVGDTTDEWRMRKRVDLLPHTTTHIVLARPVDWPPVLRYRPESVRVVWSDADGAKERHVVLNEPT